MVNLVVNSNSGKYTGMVNDLSRLSGYFHFKLNLVTKGKHNIGTGSDVCHLELNPSPSDERSMVVLWQQVDGQKTILSCKERPWTFTAIPIHLSVKCLIPDTAPVHTCVRKLMVSWDLRGGWDFGVGGAV